MAYGSTLDGRTDSAAVRKRRGAFFTPPELASYLSSFAVRSSSDAVLEPSFGEGEFLLAVGRRLLELGMSETQMPSHLMGCELHAESAQAAQARLAQQGIHSAMRVGDFFFLEAAPTFDAVVGNPPYIRYQNFSGAQAQRAREDCLRAGVRIDALASSWAPFVVHAAQFLRPGGRMALVLPAELLSANYAAPVRRFLIEGFSEVNLVLFEEPVFPEVQEEVVLLLAEGFGWGPTDSIRLRQVRSSGDLTAAGDSVIPVAGDGRWPVGVEGRAAEDLLSRLDAGSFVSLGEWGRTRLGAVTGSNGYFALTPSRVEELGLGKDDVVPLCPPGSAHLRQLDLSQARWERLGAKGERTLLFYPGDQPSRAARSYIARGEALGVSGAYKCRTRSPWWRVPGVGACDAFLTYMNGFGPNLCVNEAGLAYLNSVHGVHFGEGYRELGMGVLPTLFLSSVTQLSAEVRGRSYGGGILKLEPREACRVSVVSPDCADAMASAVLDAAPRASELLGRGRREEAGTLVDALLVREGVMDEFDVREAKEVLRRLRGRRNARGAARGRR